MATFSHILFVLYIFGASGLEMESSILGNVVKNFYQSGRKHNKCDEAVEKLVHDVKNHKEYALRMIDSMGKIPSGLFEMNTNELGAYDQCLAIDFPEDNARGKYCLAHISIPFHLVQSLQIHDKDLDNLFADNGTLESPLKFLWGLCVPAVCTAEDLSNYFPKEVHFTDPYCQSLGEPKEFKLRDIAAIWFFTAITLIIVFSTIYDVYMFKHNKVPIDALIVFSFYTNGRKLFATTDNADHLGSINGIRSITIMWIVIGHVITMSTVAPVSNNRRFFEFITGPESLIFRSGILGVDSFFAVGGMVMIYSYMRVQKHNGFNVPLYYFHRYIRLTPQLAVLVLFEATVSEFIGGGPVWPKHYDYSARNCQRFWWSAILYVQNWVNPLDWCFGESWYLCLDFQMFLLSPLILIPLKKAPKITLSAVALTACVSTALAFGAAWKYHLNPFINDNYSEFNTHYYHAIRARAAPWLIGVITGFIIYQLKFVHTEFKLKKLHVLILWILSLLTLYICIISGKGLATKERHNRWLNSLYIAFSRPAWALALSWIVSACALGYGGPINYFLSLPIFQIMARLSYSMYMINYSLLTLVSFSQKTPPRFSYMYLYEFWGHLIVICFISVIMTLAFDYPIAAIEKILKGKSAPADDKKGAYTKLSMSID